MIRLLVAMSCEPPDEECPVTASGINVIRPPASSAGVHDQRSTVRLATATNAARIEVVRHAALVSTRSAADHMSSGVSSVNGTPDTSEIVSATNSAAHTAHTAQAAPPTLSAR
ncbi:hypothetical protein MCHLDSM_03139 [Mycolicibacterium chlorophenolicum]|uniref:Uncharacterized protein n=1 Tax=Mycolicibacterium chlorophenolicum TaxID=37916 RepID=A0A0J6YVC3_9MYCO|nr:hypothetical protein MCHLDSM_03139 [Mycolicibacterium chlorophenolicum]